MIIVKIDGGLGNQLFQYAFARGVSSRLKTNFRLDINSYKTYYKNVRGYSLNCFNIKQNFAKDSDFLGFVWGRKHHKIFDLFYKYLRLKSKIMPFYYQEQTFHFDPRVFERDGTYFSGGWVTEKYFKDIAKEIREEITPVDLMSTESLTILEKIKNSNAVSVHVRRYDTGPDKIYSNTIDIQGTCSLDYYRKAMGVVSAREKNPHFFVFSDNYVWASENLKSMPYTVTFVKNEGRKDYEDMILMSSCKHNIIANSTFSWWGAWLNQNKDKIVVAPIRWLNNAKKSVNTKDVIPESWIKI